MSLTSISTPRLLKMFRQLRRELWLTNYYDYDEDDGHWQQTVEKMNLLDSMKAELDTREHVGKNWFARKEKKQRRYKR